MLIGYARVSTTGQSLEVQEAALRGAGVDKLFTEKKSGTTTAGRAALDTAADFAREGDVLIVTRLDRLARSVGDLKDIVRRLEAKGVGFRCLQQSEIDTTTSTGRLMLNILGAIAEFEGDLRRERQRDGIEAAKAKGVYKGRPRSIDAASVKALRGEGIGPAEIARRLGIGRASVYRALGGA